MSKVIKQIGKDSEMTLDWAVEQAQTAYNLIFESLDQLVNPLLTTKDRSDLVNNCKSVTNSLVKSLKIATLLSSEEAVLNSIFGKFEGLEVEVVEKPDVVDFEEYKKKQDE